jgi:hypothetical protein
MHAYVYNAELWCATCIAPVLASLPKHENSTFYPQGPYDNGGGESDMPQHCAICHRFLENPLTDDGVRFVCEALTDPARRNAIALEWGEFYGIEVTPRVQGFPWEAVPKVQVVDAATSIGEIPAEKASIPDGPYYQVILRQDAWVNHIARIPASEAKDAEEACRIAEHAWKTGDESIRFEQDDLTTFDEILVDPDDVELIKGGE